MDSVDQVTQSIPAAMPAAEKIEAEPEAAADEDRALERASSRTGDRGAGMLAPPTVVEPNWQNLITAGLTLLNRLVGPTPDAANPLAEAGAQVKIETDASTGERHLKLPVPSGEVLRGLAGLLNQLAEKL